MLLDLRHDMNGNRPYLDVWLLLAYQTIHHIQHLIAEAGLTQRSDASGERERPQHR